MNESKKEVGAGFAPGACPICEFCKVPWTEDMIKVLDVDAYHYEDDDGYDAGPQDQQATVEITCSNCNKLIYRREYKDKDIGSSYKPPT
jgi:hypothetical protein